MSLYWQNKSRNLNIYCGDSRDVLKTLPEKKFQSCITSPPYWSHRSYHNDKQIGLEDDMFEYISTLVGIFDDVYGVMRDDSTVWVNIGETWIGGGKAGNNPEYHKKHTVFGKSGGDSATFGKRMPVPKGLKARDMAGIPWRFAFAMQEKGWYLRDAIIWNKNMSSMPLSITNRTVTNFEYIFMFTKIGSGYYYDVDAIRNESGSTKRSVWNVGTARSKHKHKASYPVELVVPCVLAGCPEARCEACGTPYHRVVYTGNSESHAPPSWLNPGRSHRKKDSEGWDGYGQFKNTRKWTDEFVPGCNCNVGSNIPEILDPFGGSGTTAIAAAQNKRGCTLVELTPDYCDISIDRINKETSQPKLL